MLHTAHEVFLLLEEENDATADIFIELDNGEITDENSANEDDVGLTQNLTGNQLNAPAEALYTNDKR